MLRRITLAVFGLLTLFTLFACGSGGGTSKETGTSPASSETAARPGDVNVVFTYGSEKQVWIEETTAAFNRERHKTSSGKFIHIDAIPMGSGDCVDEILSGQRQPTLISPASAAFIKLGNAESRVKTGKDLVGPTKNLVLSPVVIAMWEPMAKALGW